MCTHARFLGFNLIILLITVVVIGCSGGSGGGSSPITPPIGDEQLQLTGQAEPEIPDTGVPHYLLGFWQILINTETGEIEQVPVRGSGFHLNIVNQMQDPMPPGLSIEIVDMNLPEGWLDFNLGFTHPFPNTNLRLFDVRGIMMGAGATVASMVDPTATRPAFDGFRLVNADGYTRWWNAQEFTTPGFFGYEQGDFGFDFTPVATINAYKYYSDPLSATDPVIPGVTLENRGTFSTDLDPPTLIRNFQLQVPVPDGLPIWLIQYAIDVNWAMPTGDSPTPKPVDDFPLEANCPEAFHINVDTSGSSAFFIDEANNGGNIQLAIEVFDWGATTNPDGIEGEIESITVESPTLFDAPVDVPVSSTGGSSISGIFNVTIPSVHPSSLEGQEIFITVKSTGVTTYVSPIGFPAYPADAELAAYALVGIPILDEDPYTGFIDIVIPNGGEQWQAGNSADVFWGADPFITDVRIELSTNSGVDYSIEVTGSTPNDGSFTWETIPVEAISDTCRIRISDVDLPASNDESDDDFEIAYGVLELVVPNGNLAWYTQTSQEITWTGGFGIENISIAMSIDSGQNYTYLIIPSTPNDGSFMWNLIPEEVVGEQCRIKVKDEGSPETFDESDDDFKVITNPITILTPNGGETWTVGTTQEILWDADPGIANVKIALSLDSGETMTLLISGGTTNDGIFMWGPIPEDVHGNHCRIKIRDSVAPNAFRISEADFTIEPDPLTLLSPNGGESWEVGDAMEITWTGAPFTDDIIIGLKIDGGEVSILITGPTPNDGSFTWNPIIPEAVSDDCTIKIRDADDADIWDFSDGAFAINPAPVNVISPNGGEVWEVGDYHEITWTADPDIENVAIGLSLNSGAFFNALTLSTPNDGIWEWTAIPPNVVSENCRIKVKDIDNWVVYDISDADFTILDVEPLVEIIQPNGGELLESGSEYEIKWSTVGWIGETVKIEYTLFDGSPNMIVESTENDGSFLWDPIPAIDSGTVRVKITSIEDPGAFGQSDEYFTIKLMHILVESPNGGESWGVGDAAEITWSADPDIENVQIGISFNSGQYFTYNITPSTPNDGSYIWDPIPADAVGTHLRVKIKDVDNGDNQDTSNADFTIFDLSWPVTWGGSGWDTAARCFTDESGNTYTTGQFSNIVDFDPGSGIDQHTSHGDRDAHISKFDQFGHLLWARTWGGSGRDYSFGVAVSNTGNVYVNGFMQNTVDFDPGPLTDNHTSSGGSDAFVVAYDSDGNYLWGRNWGGPGTDGAAGISVTPSGTAYITGQFSATADFDPGDGTDNILSAGGLDVFVSQFDASGNYLGTLTWGGTGDDWGYRIDLDTALNICVTGNFEGTMDIDPGEGTTLLTAGAGEVDSFLCKFDPGNNFQWGVNWTGYAECLTTHDSGDISVSGFFMTTSDFDPGPGIVSYSTNGVEDCYLSRFDSSGNFLWARAWGGSLADKAVSVDNDHSGNTWVTGYFSSTVDFNPGPGTEIYTAVGSTDAYISIFNPYGGLIAIETFGGSDEDKAYGLGVQNSHLGYLSGYFKGTADLEPGPEVENYTSNGDKDCFIVQVTDDWTPAQKAIQILDPNGGEEWVPGFESNVEWTWSGDIPYVDIWLSLNSGAGYTIPIAINYPNSGYINVDPDIGWISDTARIQVSSSSDGGVVDESNANFTIVDPNAPKWPVTWGGSGSDLGFNITIDADDNVFVVGRTEPAGTRDCYFAKYDQTGNLFWERTWGGTGADEAGRLNVDSQGNILIGGAFEGTVDFNPGIGTDYLSSNGSEDAFLCKFDTNGNYLWGVSFGGSSGNDNCYGIVTNGTDIYITGFFSSTNVDFDPGSGTEYRSSNGSTDIFLSKFSGSGDFQWVQTLGGSAGESTYYLAKDNFGNLGLAGYFSTTVDFDPGAGVAQKTASGNADAFVAVYDLTGAFQWVQTWGGTDFENADRLAFDQLGNVYVTGWFNGTADFYPGPSKEWHTSNGGSDIFVSKFDPSGIYKWTRVWGSTASGNLSDLPFSILENGSGQVLVAGYIKGDADFDPGPGSDIKFSNGGSDIFVSKFNATGQYIGAVTWGGSGIDQGFDMVLMNPDNVLVTGAFEGTVDLDPGPAVEFRTSNAALDGFISLVSTDLPMPSAAIEITNPNGGEYWVHTNQQTIEWDWSGSIPNVDIDLSINGGASFDIPLATGITNTGEFTVTVNPAWDSDQARILVTSSSDAGVWDISDSDFRIYELSTDGWAVPWGSDQQEFSQSMALDSQHNIYVSGRDDTISDWYTALMKFDDYGEQQWWVSWGGEVVAHTSDIAVDSAGNVFCAGYFRSEVDFDPGPGVVQFSSNGTNSDVFLSKFNTEGVFQWVKVIGNIESESFNGTVTDEFDNVYIVGDFIGTVDFNPGAGVDNHISAGETDMLLIKLDNDGNYVWGRSSGGVLDELNMAVACDRNGSIYTAGYFNGTVDFDPSGGEDFHTSSDYRDGFLAKFNYAGDYQWTRTFGGTNGDYVKAICPDPSGDVYISGHFLESIDLDPTVGENILTSNGGTDIFIVKLDADGNYYWGLALGGSGSEYMPANSIAELNNGFIAVVGVYRDVVDFDPGPGETIGTSAGDTDCFLAVFNEDGVFKWLRTHGGSGGDYLRGLGVDNEGNIFGVGFFQTTVDFAPHEAPCETETDYHTANGDYDGYVIKYLPDGCW